jgi:hypothetical protein
MMADRDFALGTGLLVFSIAGLFYAAAQNSGTTVSEYGPGFFPTLLFTVLAICAVKLIYDSMKRSQKIPLPTFNNKQIFVTAVLSVLYCFSLGLVGFKIGTIAFLVLVMLSVGKRKVQHLVVLPVVVAFGLYYLFVNVLQVMLP